MRRRSRPPGFRASRCRIGAPHSQPIRPRPKQRTGARSVEEKRDAWDASQVLQVYTRSVAPRRDKGKPRSSITMFLIAFKFITGPCVYSVLPMISPASSVALTPVQRRHRAFVTNGYASGMGASSTPMHICLSLPTNSSARIGRRRSAPIIAAWEHRSGTPPMTVSLGFGCYWFLRWATVRGPMTAPPSWSTACWKHGPSASREPAPPPCSTTSNRRAGRLNAQKPRKVCPGCSRLPKALLGDLLAIKAADTP